MPKLRKSSQEFVDLIHKEFGKLTTITRPQVIKIVTKYKVDKPWWLLNSREYRYARGVYIVPGSGIKPDTSVVNKKRAVAPAAMMPTVPVARAPIPTTTEPAPAAPVAPTMDMVSAASTVEVHHVSLVPDKAQGYVPFGHFPDLEAIINSGKFFPVYVTGLSGNGKTMMVEQVCAKLKRECIRVNITAETDEDDLIGGFRLVNGATVWHDGPVIQAMLRGAVLLLDEVDLGSIKLMCLQPVLEGKGVFLKKVNRLVHPAPGFTVIATANTKGKGSDDGRFIGTNVMNEAFLERFPITFEQDYPSAATEIKILRKVLEKNGIEDDQYCELLTKWADIVRQTFKEGGCSEIISTRRLVHICEAYSIFGKDRMKAINYCLNRFDSETKQSFADLYTKVDESIKPAVDPIPDLSSDKDDVLAGLTLDDDDKKDEDYTKF